MNFQSRNFPLFAVLVATFLFSSGSKPACNGLKPKNELTPCFQAVQTCESDCGEFNFCVWIDPDVRIEPLTMELRSRACEVVEDPEQARVSYCFLKLEACYQRRVCYESKSPIGPPQCVWGDVCEGPFQVGYTSTQPCEENLNY